jgi:hypothetical protein
LLALLREAAARHRGEHGLHGRAIATTRFRCRRCGVPMTRARGRPACKRNDLLASIGYHPRMTIRPPVIPKSTKKATPKTAEPLDIAARYLVYKLYVPGQAITGFWQPLSMIGEAAATVGRAVERGWIVLREEGEGTTKERYVALTDEGRVLARKSLR